MLAVITGASRGFGRASARALAECGGVKEMVRRADGGAGVRVPPSLEADRAPRHATRPPGAAVAQRLIGRHDAGCARHRRASREPRGWGPELTAALQPAWHRIRVRDRRLGRHGGAGAAGTPFHKAFPPRRARTYACAGEQRGLAGAAGPRRQPRRPGRPAAGDGPQRGGPCLSPRLLSGRRPLRRRSPRCQRVLPRRRAARPHLGRLLRWQGRQGHDPLCGRCRGGGSRPRRQGHQLRAGPAGHGHAGRNPRQRRHRARATQRVHRHGQRGAPLARQGKEGGRARRRLLATGPSRAWVPLDRLPPPPSARAGSSTPWTRPAAWCGSCCWTGAGPVAPTSTTSTKRRRRGRRPPPDPVPSPPLSHGPISPRTAGGRGGMGPWPAWLAIHLSLHACCPPEACLRGVPLHAWPRAAFRSAR